MKIAVGLILLTSLSLAACSKTDDVTTSPPLPEATPPAAEIAPETPAEIAAPAAEVTAAPAPVQAPTESVVPAPAASAPKPVPSKPEPVKPAAQPPVAAPSVPKPDLVHGQQIYRQACAFCHDKGVAGAPKLGDAAAWTPRMTQGMDALYTAALRGKGAMPAKGGNPSLGETDIKAAVDYLLAQSR